MIEKIKIETEVTKYKCDFCDCCTTHNSSYGGGMRMISQCCICKKDVCDKHRYTFWEHYTHEGYEYYNSITTCLQCKPIVEKIWEEEKEEDECAEYEGRLVYIVRKRLEEIKK